MKRNQLKNIEIVELNISEMRTINAGCFSYDVGWGLGFVWEAFTNDYVGMAMAIVKYKTHNHQ